jgi:hypothetical protein
MEKTRPVELLKSFSSQELKAFGRFLESPYFNTNEKVCSLYELLKSQHPFASPRLIDRRKIYAALFPGEAFNDQRIRDLSSILLKLLESFLTVQSLKKNPAAEKRLLLKELDGRRMDSLFETRFREAEKAAGSGNTGAYAQLDNFLLQDIYSEYLHRRFHGRSDKATGVHEYKKLADSQLRFTLLWMLETITFHHSQHTNFNQPFVLGNYIQPLISLYHASGMHSVDFEMRLSNLQMLMTGEEEHYFRLKELLLSEPSQDISLVERKNFLTNLTNFCNRKMRQGDENFLSEMITLYDIVVEADELLLLEYGSLSHIFFTNYVIMHLRSGNIEKASGFIEKYGEYIPEEFRDDTLNFSKAHVAYSQKDHRKALQLLSLAKAPNGNKKIEIKFLQLMIFYDRQDFEQAQFTIDALLHQVKGDTYGEAYRRSATNFVKIYRQLLNLCSNSDKKGAGALLKSIASTGDLSNRFWLKEKAAELGQK